MPTSKANQRAVAKYMKNNYEEVKVRVKKGEREIIKKYAESLGESTNEFINRLIWETIWRDQTAEPVQPEQGSGEESREE